jgi:hypothetical protein
MRRILSFLLALCLSYVVFAQAEGNGRITGTLRRGTTAVPGARIAVDSAVRSNYTGAATTSSTGRFTITSAPVGEVEVKAYDSQGNLLASTKTRIAKAGDTVTVALRIE